MEVKQFIIDNIENQKQKKIQEYDDKIKRILKEDNKANIYYLLAQTFHNTMTQGDIGIKYLQNILTNNFFKNANIKNGVNYIIFFDKEFEIMFSKSLSREIAIKYKNTSSRPYYSTSVSSSAIKLADLIEKYLDNKTFSNFKNLVNHNCYRRKKNLINKIIGYINTYKKCNEKLLCKIREKQEEDRVRKEKYEEDLKEFNDKQQYANNVITNLTDLKMFIDSGWYITKYGIVDENGCIKY